MFLLTRQISRSRLDDLHDVYLLDNLTTVIAEGVAIGMT